MLKLERLQYAEGTGVWALYEIGRISTPLRLLTDTDIESLLRDIETHKLKRVRK